MKKNTNTNPGKKSIWKWLTVLGPGLTTGAADDDPFGIATYSQTGAQFGYGQLWTALYMLPFMTAVQEACARIGLVTGKGIAAVVKDNYNRTVLYGVVGLVVIANTINIGADIGAMASAAQLLIPIPFTVLTLSFTALILLLEIFTNYKVYSRILKWLALTLLSYPITVFIIHQDWPTVLKATVTPHFEFNFAFLFIITGVFGTTITPYMFFWEASQEVEEEREKGLLRKGKPAISWSHIHRMRKDNTAGMIISEFTTWCILLVGATVLHNSGIKDLKTAADAAKALEPLVHSFPNAGYLAKLIFSVGIIGLGLLAVPVLSGSAAYAVSEAANWNASLNLKLKRAHGFYGVITIATVIGLIINFVGINPVKALVFTAVLNGVAAVPLLFLIVKITASEKIMGEYKSGWLSKALLWITFIVMGAASVALFFTL
ncbi:NRAMP (natural resistance-associated macrophage protein) metal ion transporters [Mucilaginibacter lappiensis]|uniref:NRAMP (Natural resistance-associated macrophage protein)-like metal ion transporter n=1 Tax=Mucilaginibacter lappiensis TaxID=354630 RepID=A0ABR6PD89_9SPHI|nr:divalent metal cation transporter [Mucilaginibacter lappiensis]MBB6107712.1 NRAMP (natural resistance-associated macrophage protein)-like metal ion transporter [Mucilaginibacter lappiensis]SIP99526.1 NRAMP (natural resistance-associated macrophage protein) metal ion transporters [Mucilaginibacter lappiensis]